MTPEDQEILRAALDRAVESIAAEISTGRQETNARLEAIERRLERMHERLNLLWTGQATIESWAERLDVDHGKLGQNYFNQERAIEALTKRVEALERKAS